MRSVSTARLGVGSEFEKFLYAPVGQDRDGMPLTVLSALARQDVDPWEEAAKLTRLPEERAVAHLVILLAPLGPADSACPELVRLAAPLIALLPRHRDLVTPLLRWLARAAPRKHPAVVSTALCIVTYVIFMLFSNWLFESL